MVHVGDVTYASGGGGPGHQAHRVDRGPRFSDLGRLTKNSAVSAELFDQAFGSRSFDHWKDALSRERVTFAVIQMPEDSAKDPQLRANEIVVPIEGVAGMGYTVNRPVTLRGIPKVPAKRAPELEEHNDEILAGLCSARGDCRAARPGNGAPERTGSGGVLIRAGAGEARHR
ncbi:CoA transferase [Streptomyces sp. NPDC051286]|uniref:CoA transferase n=1 Tax=Streptomyces sp. NPDC051286 TaxID=3365647 RepID=UPI0037B32251